MKKKTIAQSSTQLNNEPIGASVNRAVNQSVISRGVARDLSEMIKVPFYLHAISFLHVGNSVRLARKSLNNLVSIWGREYGVKCVYFLIAVRFYCGLFHSLAS